MSGSQNGILSFIAGQASSTAFSAPIGVGKGTVGPGQVFGKFLNNIMTAFTPGGGTGSSSMVFPGGVNPVTGTNPNAIQAFRNLQFGQGAGGVNQNLMNQTLPGIQQGSLQGIVGQSGLTGGTSSLGGGQLPGGPLNLGGIGLPNPSAGKGMMLLYPVIGLISMIKSVFGIRKLLSGTREPLHVDKEKLAFNQTGAMYKDMEAQEGSFDEYNYAQENNESYFDIKKLDDL